MTAGGPDNAAIDAAVKKALRWRAGRRELSLDVPADVFSTYQVDRGTRLLLRRIDRAEPAWEAALDLGCGYGPIALHLAAAGRARRVDAVDRDALAVAFAQRNAAANGLDNVRAAGGLAWDGVPGRDYDAVVTNLPAKAGESVHRLLLLGAAERLSARGEVWAVVVQPLAERIDAMLAEAGVELRDRDALSGHVVYRYALPAAPPPVPDDAYLRSVENLTWREHAYELTARHGLAEFDSRSWQTDLLLDVLADVLGKRPVERLACCDPTQGHVPLLAARLCPRVAEIDLVGRDLLALGAAEANLRGDGFPGAVRTTHAAGLSAPAGRAPLELAAWTVSEKAGLDFAIANLRALLASHPTCRVLVAARSAFASRLITAARRAGLQCPLRKKRKGYCVQLFQHTQ